MPGSSSTLPPRLLLTTSPSLHSWESMSYTRKLIGFWATQGVGCDLHFCAWLIAESIVQKCTLHVSEHRNADIPVRGESAWCWDTWALIVRPGTLGLCLEELRDATDPTASSSAPWSPWSWSFYEHVCCKDIPGAKANARVSQRSPLQSLSPFALVEADLSPCFQREEVQG